MIKYILLLFSLLLSCSSASDNDDNPTPIDTNELKNLKVEISNSNDGSGKINVSASAENAVNYSIDYNNNTEEVQSSNGQFEHTYKSNGTYSVVVKAFGNNNETLFSNHSVRVLVTDYNLDDGYDAPMNYDNMTLAWQDEFDGSSLDTSTWSYDIGNGCPELCGWGNNELEYYRAENVEIENGVLSLIAKREVFDGFNFTSGKIVTRHKRLFQFGRLDIRAKLPSGQGIWPAIWLLGDNQEEVGWPQCGEIDIMEMVGGQGKEKTTHGNVFWYDGQTKDQPSGRSLETGLYPDQFHVFSIVWTSARIEWFVDNNLFHSFDLNSDSKDEFQLPFYLLFNVAVGGNWPGNPDNFTVFPTTMHIDYVRYYEFN